MGKEKPSLSARLPIPALLQAALLALAVIFLVLYLWIACSRMHYPFDLEWIEGGMVNQVARLLHGQGMYVAPDVHYVPFLYPPLYFILSAAAALLAGGGPFPLRLVSFLASLVSLAVIYQIVRNETRDDRLALLSSGLFAAAFRITGAWLDIARVDSLFLACYLLFLYFAIGRSTFRNAILAGLCAALAYLTKQTALIACLPVLAWLFWRGWEQALAALAAAALLIGATTLAFQATSQGWYGYYVFSLLSQQTQWLAGEFITFWNDDLLVHVPIAILFAGSFLAGLLRSDRLRLAQWASILLGALAGSFLTRVKIGGYDNVLLPLYAVLAIFFGLGLHELLGMVCGIHSEYRQRLEGLLLFAALLQLVMLFYNPFAQIPSPSDLAAGNRLIQTIARVKGEVFVPDHSSLAALAGKSVYAHNSAIWDVLRGDQPTQAKTWLAASLAGAIQQQRFDLVILDSDLDAGWCCSGLEQTYTKVDEIFLDETSFFTLTGDRKRPTSIYMANRLR